MSHPSKIISFMACRKCAESGQRTNRTATGLIDAWTIRLWCERHNMLIADFTLAAPIPPRCDVCGEEIGPDHVH